MGGSDSTHPGGGARTNVLPHDGLAGLTDETLRRTFDVNVSGRRRS